MAGHYRNTWHKAERLKFLAGDMMIVIFFFIFTFSFYYFSYFLSAGLVD